MDAIVLGGVEYVPARSERDRARDDLIEVAGYHYKPLGRLRALTEAETRRIVREELAAWGGSAWAEEQAHARIRQLEEAAGVARSLLAERDARIAQLELDLAAAQETGGELAGALSNDATRIAKLEDEAGRLRGAVARLEGKLAASEVALHQARRARDAALKQLSAEPTGTGVEAKTGGPDYASDIAAQVDGAHVAPREWLIEVARDAFRRHGLGEGANILRRAAAALRADYPPHTPVHAEGWATVVARARQLERGAA